MRPTTQEGKYDGYITNEGNLMVFDRDVQKNCQLCQKEGHDIVSYVSMSDSNQQKKNIEGEACNRVAVKKGGLRPNGGAFTAKYGKKVQGIQGNGGRKGEKRDGNKDVETTELVERNEKRA